jgi:hypothetical protein
VYFANAWRFVRLAGHARPAPHLLDRLFERGLRDARLLEQPATLALVADRRDEEHLGGDELVASFLRFLVRDVEQCRQLARHVHLARRALDLGQPADRLRKRLLEGIRVAPRLGDQRRGAALLLLEQCEQEVLRLDVLVVLADRPALGVRQGFLELGGELVEAHRPDPVAKPVTQVGTFAAVSSKKKARPEPGLLP